MPPIPKRKTARAPPVDKLIKPAVGVVLAMIGYLVFQGMQSEIPRIDVDDELMLRDVFFGEGVEVEEGSSEQGEQQDAATAVVAGQTNYVVLCHTDRPNEKSSTLLPISSVFQDARNEAAGGSQHAAEFRLLDCTHVLPMSNQTVAEKFNLDLNKRPTIFVSGKNGPPKQIPLKHLKTGHMLVKILRQMLEPHATKIENTKQLKTKCLSKDYCAVFLKGASGTVDKRVKASVQNLIVEYPKVQFASIDSSVLLLTNLENNNIPEFSRGNHRFIIFKKVSGSLEAKNGTAADAGRLITSVANYKSADFRQLPISTFVDNAIKGKISFEKVPALPAMKTRTKKNEEQERKKRERVRERLAREEEKKRQEASGGAFTSTPGDNVKDARKAERDRIREEHKKEQEAKERELTPEEKAEKERLRRQRMEEEAKKWNIMSEDDEDDAGSDEEEAGGESGEEDGEEVVDDWDDEEDDSGDDVMDLD